jgi:hypothetical protein
MENTEKFDVPGNPREEIYITEMSLKELLEGKTIYDDDGWIVIHPPKTNELGIMLL